ncbi:MAG TPA: hypothetical protein GXX46_02380 [Peptococcaceae bacterium]|nr:hypothetical protein [Peptococcaceae bacterium]
MSKKKRIAVNLLIFALLLMVFMTVEGAALTPEGALKKQERTRNYGHSEPIALIEQGKHKFFLCKFRDHYSCPAVKRGFLGFWYESQAGCAWGDENKKEKAVNCSLTGERNKEEKLDTLYIYGIINDDRITSLDIEIFIENSQGERIIKKTTAVRPEQAGAVGKKSEKEQKVGAEKVIIGEAGGMGKISQVGETGVIYQDMFFAVINEPGMSNYYCHKLSAFDQDGNLIFEEER